MKRLILTFIIMALPTLSPAATADEAILAAQQEAAAMVAKRSAAEETAHSPLTTHTCSFNFTTGNGDALLRYCVTANGNIAQIESPQSIELISAVPVGEGYAICDANTNTRYFDYADFGDSGNWAEAKVLMQNATTVKIARTTSDGIYTLTQTITQVPGVLPWIRVAMAVKNNSSVTRPVIVVRYADVDADGLTKNNFDTTNDSAFGWNSLSGGAGFGLLIQNVGKGSDPFGPIAEPHPQGPDPCVSDATVSLQAGIDGSIGMSYNLNIPKGKTTTVTASYRGM